MSQYIPNAYQTPNILVDRHLRKGLIDNDQLAILVVLIRETFGWNNFDRHKKISISRFMEFMPRSSRSTIIRRLQGLQEIGLIDTQKEPGKENQYKLSDVFFNPTSVTVTPDQCQSDTGQAGGSVTVTPDQCQSDTGSSVTVTPVLKTILNPSTKTQRLNPDAPPARAAVIASLQKLNFATSDAGDLVDRYGPEAVNLQLQRLEWGMRHAGWAAKVKSRKGWIVGSLKQAETGEGYNIPEGFVSSAERDRAQAEREAREAEHRRREAERQAAEAAEAARETAINRAYLDFLATLPQGDKADIQRTAMQLLHGDAGGFAWHRYQAGLKLGQELEDMPAVYPVYLRHLRSTARARYPDADLPDPMLIDDESEQTRKPERRKHGAAKTAAE